MAPPSDVGIIRFNESHANSTFRLVRGVTLGEGQGTSRELAKSAASKNALTYLNLNGLPRRQD
jgi:dsRNA-specific ribonuclease